MPLLCWCWQVSLHYSAGTECLKSTQRLISELPTQTTSAFLLESRSKIEVETGGQLTEDNEAVLRQVLSSWVRLCAAGPSGFLRKELLLLQLKLWDWSPELLSHQLVTVGLQSGSQQLKKRGRMGLSPWGSLSFTKASDYYTHLTLPTKLEV